MPEPAPLFVILTKPGAFAAENVMLVPRLVVAVNGTLPKLSFSNV